jgi:hypothetical protein
MKTKLASVLGLAVLMACFICGSSFVYADDVLEVASSAMQTFAPDATANGAESVDKLPCESSCVGTEHCTGDAQTVEADQPSSAASEIEPSVTEASPAPAVQSADAIIVEVTQTVTIVVPGDDAADSEEPAVTGSILEPTATEPAAAVEAAATDASPATEVTEVTEAADAIVAEVVQTVTIAAPGQDAGDSEASAVAESTPEPSATEPALTRDAELP